ncbi:AAA family ATPase [uncultured Flavobacterium sp.]|uniref:ATP-dependent nuclease n=1 Tax=uncultured Flavobacterium sp. TaxID=165435 RepID=UPI0027E078B0|nr:AAA family ATPase [uncultured Flavobacterium sp.]
MKLIKISISNFRGINHAEVLLSGHTVLIGDNNTGKSTVLEAVDLVLGPDRLSRMPVINEHDFFEGIYLNQDGPVPIEIEIIIGALSQEQKRKFMNNLEFWNHDTLSLVESGPLDLLDDIAVEEVIRVKFSGKYDIEEDDFTGETFFCSPEETKTRFTKSDKRDCGFLYLRALRTGTRALSLERGSLLDIILRIQELRPQMWESILKQLRETEVNSGAEDEVNKILSSVQKSLKQFVPTDWGSEPHLRVSNLTREHLRKTLVVFMSSGSGNYHVPFSHQGTGTINTMVLALLSMIAELKQSVIFAMEEPEIAIPPYTQKRIVNSIRNQSAQAIFTSHSPFVLEEFSPEQIVLLERKKGIMKGMPLTFPSNIKPKAYSKEFRMRFSESLLAKRVLIAEGDTEASAYNAAARCLSELDPQNYSSFEAMGISVFNAESENSIPIFAKYFSELGKTTIAVCDKQSDAANLKAITESAGYVYESAYKGFENLILTETPISVLKKYITELVSEQKWPQHLKLDGSPEDMEEEVVKSKLFDYLKWQKASGSAADILALCTLAEFPATLRDAVKGITDTIDLI